MAQNPRGVSGPVRRLGASLVTLGRIRLELLALEIQEEKDRVTSLLFWAVFTALLACFGVVFIALFATVALWDTHRLAALGVAAAVLVCLAVLGGVRLQRLVARPATLFQSSIAELRQDSAALQTTMVTPASTQP
jgi:uncharacterized membrane protein YqjE